MTSAPFVVTSPQARVQSRAVPHNVAPVYRSFFLSAIVMALTLGASWGATLLWRIGVGGSFTAVSAHEVNAHGLAQIYGWVGLFIMGFAYTVFPRMWRSPAPSRWLAMLALSANLIGVVLSAAGMRLIGIWPGAPLAAIAGAVLIVISVTVFGAQIVSAFERRRVALEPAFLFMLAAVGWLLLSSAFSAAHTWMTVAASNREQLIEVISTYQAALRDLQIHGLALTMILGVSLKILPGMFGLPRISQRRAMLAFAFITLAVAGETSFFIASRWSELTLLASVMYLFWIMRVIGAGAIIVKWQPWRPLPRDDGRSGKFIRAAFIWLGISLLMLMLMPIYQVVVGLPFSHAYYGAARHAITVGSVSIMIMGVAARFVPAMRCVAWRDLSSLTGPFILINSGCALRIVLQIGTDVHPMGFTLVGVSSVLEVIGLAWWALDLSTIMLRRIGDTTERLLPVYEPNSDATDSADRGIPGSANNEHQPAEDQPCCAMCAAHNRLQGES